MVDEREEFLISLVDFYKTFFGGISDSIEMLSGIQKKHPEQYSEILAFNKDPEAINDIMEELDSEQQTILLKLLLKASSFSRRMNSVLHLNPEEQKKLADDLAMFSEEYAEHLGKLREKLKK